MSWKEEIERILGSMEDGSNGEELEYQSYGEELEYQSWNIEPEDLRELVEGLKEGQFLVVLKRYSRVAWSTLPCTLAFIQKEGIDEIEQALEEALNLSERKTNDQEYCLPYAIFGSGGMNIMSGEIFKHMRTHWSPQNP